MKFLMIIALSLSATLAQAQEVIKLECYATHAVQKPDGQWTREAVARGEETFELGVAESVKKISLDFVVDGEEVSLEGYGAIRELSFGKIRMATVTSRITIPSRRLSLLDLDGLQEQITSVQGDVATSSTSILLGEKSDDSYHIGCTVHRSL